MDFNIKSIMDNPYVKNFNNALREKKDINSLFDDSSKMMEELKNKIFGDDEISLSKEGLNSLSRYQSINILQENTYAQFKDENGNEFTYAKSVFKLSYTDVVKAEKEIAEEESEEDKRDEALGEWSSDAVSERLVDFAKNVFNLFQTDKYSGDESLKDPKNFMQWAKSNILQGFEQAQGLLNPIMKNDDFLTNLIDKTYNKTMKGLEDAFGVKDEPDEVSEGSESSEVYYEESFEYELEVTYVGVKFSDASEVIEE